MYDWVVVGGGIHGVTIATFLLRAAGVSRDKLRIVDPNQRLLRSWTERAEAVGMKSLRSSLVHHIDVDPFSLKKFADSSEGSAYGKLRGKYGHPDLDLFNAHCRRVVEENALESLHIVDSVVDLSRSDVGDGKWGDRKKVVLSNETLSSRNVVLALGNPEPLWPEWVRSLSTNGTSVFHCFDLERSKEDFRGKNVAVIGGGLTAAQAALKIASGKARRVKIFSRHPLKKAQFDSDPGWIGPKYRSGFERIDCPIAKRRKIVKARHRGSITPEVLRVLNRAVREQAIELEIGSHLPAMFGETAEDSQECFAEFDALVLATGFEQCVPGAPLITEISKEFGLALSPCGVPLLKRSVHWGEGLYVSGALAEMRIGPVARNIPGARSAAAEIVRKALSDDSSINTLSAFRAEPRIEAPSELREAMN